MRLFILLILFPSMLFGQKALQYEKGGSLNTMKFFIGDEVTFKINDSDIWYTRIIWDINVEQNYLVIENQGADDPVNIYIKDITHIKIKKRKTQIGSIIGQALIVGGFNTILGTIALSRRGIVPTITEDPTPIYTGLGGSAIGYVIYKLFTRDGKKLNDRRRLRLIDTTIYLPSA